MNVVRRGVMVAAALASAATWPGTAAAQARGESFYKLTLKEGIAPLGRVGGFTGTVDANGHRILAENLSVVQPVTVLVIATDPAKPVRADLVKGAWDEPLRSGTTDGSGQVVFNARTEGNMGILLRSAGGEAAPYQLAVWVGPETPSEPAPIFAASRARARAEGGGPAAARGGSGASPVGERTPAGGYAGWIFGAAGTIAIVAAGAFVLRRRSRARNGSAIVLSLLAVPVLLEAQIAPPKFWSDGLKDAVDKGMKDAQKFMYDKLKDPKNWDPDKWKETWETLSPEDKSYDEDYDPPGMPEVPLKCAESEECAACFEPAYARLKAVRIRFEKLRRVYAWTKAYKERAFALGDSAAGIHGLAGLAWVGERVKLERSYKRFEAAYDAKYEELVDELRGALEQIAECEEQVYGEEGWFNRYGFIYFQFMADRYRRS